MKRLLDLHYNKFDIKIPIWRNGRMLGLNAAKLGKHNEVICSAVDSDGDRLFPDTYYISGEKARTYPTEPVKKFPHIILHIIPIADLEIMEDD